MKTKLGVIFLVAVIASAGIGTSYACYFGNFNWNGYGSYYFNWNGYGSYCVNHIGIRGIATGDPGPNFLQPGGALYPTNPPDDGTPDPQYPPGHNDEGKNVASTKIKNRCFKCYIYKDGQCINLYEKVKVKIHNAYPWYASSVTIAFGNCGDTGGRIDNITLEYVNGNASLLDFIVIYNWTLMKDGELVANGSSEEDLYASLYEVVLCPKELLSVYIAFYFAQEIIDDEGVVHVLPECNWVCFSYKITWKQELCDGYEGHTPGWWRRKLDEWDKTPYNTTDLVRDLFENVSIIDVNHGSDLGSKTLLQALYFMGGPNVVGMARNLLRHGVAAVLNAAHPDINYPIPTDAEVINAVNDALATEDRDIMEDLKDELAGYNQLGADV